jgi:N-acetyl-gamma-glutamylphosphate reductase
LSIESTIFTLIRMRNKTTIPSLRANLKLYNTTDHNHDDELSVLRKLAFDVTKPGQTTIGKHVTTAYKLRVTKSVEDANIAKLTRCYHEDKEIMGGYMFARQASSCFSEV